MLTEGRGAVRIRAERKEACLARKLPGGLSRPEIGEISAGLRRRVREACALLLAGVGLYLLLMLFGYHPDDPSWANNLPDAGVRNPGGVWGAWLAHTLYFIFGGPALALFPLAVFASAWLLFRGGTSSRPSSRHFAGDHWVVWLAFVLTIFSGCGLATLHFTAGALPATAGGVLGEAVARSFHDVFGMVGATLLLTSLVIAGFTLMTGLPWLRLMDTLGALPFLAARHGAAAWQWLRERRRAKEAGDVRTRAVAGRKRKLTRTEPPRIEPSVEKLKPGKRIEKERQITLPVGGAGGELPPLQLLDEPPPHADIYSKEDLETLARQLEIKMGDFGIEAEVVEARPGPVVTRFEVMPAPGTKASAISSLEKDLARSLSVPSLRVVEVIPGKSVMGIETPNRDRNPVLLGEILRSAEYDKAAAPLTLALGKDISGAAVFTDLERMPHLLVAGTTGSGKSVAVHTMLMSLLFRNTPAQVRLILMDPKMLELKAYEDIPHLLTPVITDMKEAANALHWAVVEMERRYSLMAALGVRNITSYNRRVADAAKSGQPLTDPLAAAAAGEEGAAPAPALESMPLIVVVMDEFADMMMIVGKKVEDLIVRLSQKARAAGVHLVLATQRPSVNIVTGLVKANVPARIAFQVSSKVDSRTILDQNGAEQLLGRGDMLFLPPGQSVPERVHGAFVGDHEVLAVTDFLRAQGKAEYLDGLVDAPAAAATAPGFEDMAGDGADTLYDEAVAIVTQSRKASISYLQRRLKIGYNRAARMVEDMETAGIVSPVQPNGGREVLAAAPPEA